MPQYGLYDEKSGTIKSYNKEEARTRLENRLNTAASKEEKQKGMSDFLTGIQSEVRFESTRQTAQDRAFSDKYKNLLSAEERKKQMGKSGTELYQKRKSAEALEAEEKKRSDKQTARANAASEREGLRLSDPGLKAISRFMTGNTRKDANLLTQYRSGGPNRTTALKEMIKRFMKIDPESIDITSEKNIAANAEKLENLSEKLFTIQYLITVSPQTYNSLDEDFRDRFEIRYGKAKTVAAYYRLKKHVMKNEYYRIHLNKEIGRSPDAQADPEQKLLSELIWQAEGGLKLVMQRADNYVYDKAAANLVHALRVGDARLSMQKLSEKLEKRRERIKKEGLNTHLDKTALEERDIDVKGKLNLAGHARNIQEIKLTGDPDKDLDSLTKIMDQLDTLEGAADFKEKNPDSYLLDQSDRQIYLCEAALAARGALKRMQEDLLFMARLRADDSIDTTDRTKKNLSQYRKRYLNDLKDYHDIMDMFRMTKNQSYDPVSEKNPADRDFEAIERTPELEKRAKKMLVELTEDGFSDKGIYSRINEIYVYSVKLADTEQAEVFLALANRAKALWNEKRYLNLLEVQKKDPDRKDFDEELRSLEQIHKDRFGYYDKKKKKEEAGTDYTYEPILKLRNEAMEKKLDFEDLKSRSSYYMFQYQWLKSAYPDFYTEKVGFFEEFLLDQGKFWYGKDKTKDYGKGSYERVKQNMEQFPREFRNMEADQPIFLQRGDADFAPPVEITKYYRDKDKLYIAKRCKVLKSLLGFVEDNAPFKANLEKLTEAIGIYSETQCAVTDDSLEIELAAIDTFRSEADQFFMKKGRIDLRDPYTEIIVDIMQTIDSFARGSLRNEMTDAEFAAALEQTAVYTEHSGNDLKESNVKDLPLFTHRPNINDTKQGMCGDCHFLAAIQTMVASDPEAVQKMFYDVGDGTVLVRLYVGYDRYGRRNDDFNEMKKKETILRPTYVRVRKDYERDGSYAHDCIWVQLLEKAVAAAGLMHGISEVDEKGKLENFHYEISSGASDKDLLHFIGNKNLKQNDTYHNKAYLLPAERRDTERHRMLLKGVPLYLQEKLWPLFAMQYGNGDKEDDSPGEFLKLVDFHLKTKRKDYLNRINIFTKEIKENGLFAEADADELKEKL